MVVDGKESHYDDLCPGLMKPWNTTRLNKHRSQLKNNPRSPVPKTQLHPERIPMAIDLISCTDRIHFPGYLAAWCS